MSRIPGRIITCVDIDGQVKDFETCKQHLFTQLFDHLIKLSDFTYQNNNVRFIIKNGPSYLENVHFCGNIYTAVLAIREYCISVDVANDWLLRALTNYINSMIARLHSDTDVNSSVSLLNILYNSRHKDRIDYAQTYQYNDKLRSRLCTYHSIFWLPFDLPNKSMNVTAYVEAIDTECDRLLLKNYNIDLTLRIKFENLVTSYERLHNDLLDCSNDGLLTYLSHRLILNTFMEDVDNDGIYMQILAVLKPKVITFINAKKKFNYVLQEISYNS